MKLVNISSKIISVNDIPVMPDAAIEINEGTASNEAVQALVNMKLLKIENEPEQAKDEKPAPAEDPVPASGSQKSDKKPGKSK